MGRIKDPDDLVPDRDGRIGVAVRLHKTTIKKLHELTLRAEASTGFIPTRSQIVTGLINKAIKEDGSAEG